MGNVSLIELAIFDMDHTIIDTDCDVSWKYYLVEQGLAPVEHRQEADQYFDLYHRGKTPVSEFIKFQLSEFVDHTEDDMRVIAASHFEKHVQQFVYPDAKQLIQRYNTEGVFTAILTGTSRIIAEPVAGYLGIKQLIATEPEIIDGQFTGQIHGTYLMKEAKLELALHLSSSMNISLDKVAYYADSITDVPLLEQVGNPVVINPKPELLAIAKANYWGIETWQVNGASPVTKS